MVRKRVVVVVISVLVVFVILTSLKEQNVFSHASVSAYNLQISHQFERSDGNKRHASSINVKSQNRDFEELTSVRDEEDEKEKKISLLSKQTKSIQQTLESNQLYSGEKNVTSKLYTYIYNETALFSVIQKHRRDSGYMPPHNETCKKRVPKCIILGVKKSGTRELIDFMSLHPNIVIKRNPYEFGYFAQRYYRNNSAGTEWYRKQMPCSFSDQITVTKYAWYFSNPLAAKRMYSFDKAMKLIVLVREPVERLISGLTFKFGNRLKVPSIERHLLLKNGDINKNHEEVNLSSYDIAIMNYLKYFKLKQILIIELEEFKSNPHQVLQRVESFLGLQHIISAESFVYNPDKHFYCVRNHEKVYCYGSNRGRQEQPKLSDNIRKKLNMYFRSHNENFFNITGKRYDW